MSQLLVVSEEQNQNIKILRTFFMLVSTFYQYQLILCLLARLMLASSFHAYWRP
jgi:hypothetical protein